MFSYRLMWQRSADRFFFFFFFLLPEEKRHWKSLGKINLDSFHDRKYHAYEITRNHSMIYDDYAEIIPAFPPGSLLGSTARRQTRRETRRWIIHSTPRGLKNVPPIELERQSIGYWELEEAARNSVQGCQPDLWIVPCLFVQS